MHDKNGSAPKSGILCARGGGRIARQMTLMELLGMERQQLQTRRELETFRVEARVAQVREKLGRAGVCRCYAPAPVAN